MDESKSYFNSLISKYYERTANASEIDELFRLLGKADAEKDMAAFMEIAYQYFEPVEDSAIVFDREKMLRSILGNTRSTVALPAAKMTTIAPQLPVHKKSFTEFYKYAAAAVVFLLLSAGLYIYMGRSTREQRSEMASNAKNRILPGSNKAVLTLSDGSEIALDDIKNGILAHEGQMAIHKSDNGQISYVKNGTDHGAEANVFNTINIPLGGQYQIVLPDGTRVWLNAGSSLKFPTFFGGKERTVELSGEGYFEVAKNKQQPFHVKIADVEVAVLGTHFNIMGYPEEGQVKTSLLEGAVSISKGSGKEILRPGQQAVVNQHSDQIHIRTADLEEAVAWKNGYFMFDNEHLESVMRKLARWYNVDIIYRGNFSGVVFSGNVSRFEHVSEVLKTLELTEMVHFKIEERRIIVMQ
ncbi:FecR family protein [Pedobacter sp. AW31-3R]|uniref:FecR family protein n=1 Tax=Pedobacter sp. AW31-3R TaxID=3445781 RepID=UPI003F9EEEA4